MPNPDLSFLPSVLDRLLDNTPDGAPARSRSRAQQLTELRDSVRRDLEALLNTHHGCQSPPAALAELRHSLFDYGVPDFLATNAGAAGAREEFRRSVEDIIGRFEPRFKVVKVSLLDTDTALDRTLRFKIEALMYAEPAPERVSFDSLLDPSSHSFAVTG